MAEKFAMTQAGLDEKKAERYDLEHNVLPKVIDDLQEARGQGDLSENADYDAAREKQSQVKARIDELNVIISNAEVVEVAEDTSNTNIFIGSTVTLKDLSENVDMTVKIGGYNEGKPFDNQIASNSPLAEAIMGKQVGDKVWVDRVDDSYQVEILKIN